VPEVSIHPSFCAHHQLNIQTSRCTSLPSDLDAPSLPRSHDHTDVLLDAFGDDELWDEYGVDADIIVCACSFEICLNMKVDTTVAIYSRFSSCEYS
jgi:hypothetical protein